MLSAIRQQSVSAVVLILTKQSARRTKTQGSGLRELLGNHEGCSSELFASFKC